MKSGYKQKYSKVQSMLNMIERGGGGTGGDAYTKAESDAKFETQTHAAATYQPKAGMTDYIKVHTGGYVIINGIRLYVSSTAPTGDIPDGSIGVGWE